MGDHQSGLEHEPCAAPAIQEALHKAVMAYSPVRTLMDRMVGKRLLSAEKIRNLTLYRSAITRAEAQKGELLYALKNSFNGALTPMVQCLLEAGDLSVGELAELETLIKRNEKKPEKNNPLREAAKQRSAAL